MIRNLYALGFGIYFGLLQTAYFFQLEILLTAAYTGFITATLAWIGGAILGLILQWSWAEGMNSARGFLLWHGAGLGAYYLALTLLNWFPYDFSLLPAYCILIMVSGGQAGHFFRANQRLYPSASSLFLAENNGFILGWIAGFCGFAWAGVKFHHIGPISLALALIPLLWLHLRAAGASQTAGAKPE